MKKRILALMLTAALTVSLAAGCGSGGDGGSKSDGDDITLTFLDKHPEEEYKGYFEDAIADFEEANPGVHIEYENISDQAIKEKLAVLASGGDLPDIFFAWAKAAEEKGIEVIIAGAGKAAHLPGMCAAIFPLPVIGIPMKTSDLGGVDSLYSIVQMPSGIPVATVAINGGANAGILAAKILAVSDKELRARLKDYSEKLKNDVVKKAEKLEEIGYQKYLESMKK